MKYYVLAIMLFALSVSNAKNNPVFNKLAGVNTYWTQQPDINDFQYPEYRLMNDREWIRLHLSLVEQVLRKRKCNNLSPEQYANRLQTLNHLHAYWQSGAFPINDKYDFRTPIFIDDYDNFCAVGYLMKATGFEHISRKVAAQTNLAYVKDMNYPELVQWANEYGFKVNELAWIQPTYFNPGLCSNVGKGVNGSVYELYADTAAQRLYVGGIFTTADSSITVNNIAYVTETSGVYTWHNLGNGVKGKVNAIVKYNGNIYAGGILDSAGAVAVNNVAVWNGTNWQAAGCINGEVKDLIVYRDSLYACGLFGICGNTSPANFAVWRNGSWHTIAGLTGTVNVMKIKDTTLYLGGGFNYSGNMQNIIRWKRSTGFSLFANKLNNEVKDIEVFKDTVYAVCKHTSAIDTILYSILKGNNWDSLHNFSMFKGFRNVGLSVNAICANADTMMIGGSFEFLPLIMGYYSKNFKAQIPMHYWNNGTMQLDYVIDSIIHKMVAFKGRLFFGGDFKKDNVSLTILNGIGIQAYVYVNKYIGPNARPKKLKDPCYNMRGVAYANATGKPPFTYLWSNGETTDTAKNLPSGNATVIVTDSLGLKDTATIFLANQTIDMTVYPAPGKLSAKTIAGTYTWVDCDSNYSIIQGATYQNFYPAKSGRYALVISKYGCIDTSICHAVTVNQTNIDNESEHKIVLSPNPATDYVTLLLPYPRKINVTISDLLGKTVLVKHFDENEQKTIIVSELANGCYIIKMSDEKDTYYYRLLKL